MPEPPPSVRQNAGERAVPEWGLRRQPSDPVASILVVDDRPENLLSLEVALEPLGQRIVTASSGAAALRCILREDFAVVLLDIHMPGLDGIETAALIKGSQRSKHTPIIFLTATDDSSEIVTRAYRHGGVDFLTKPLNLDIMRSKVMVFVELFVLNERVRRQRHFLEALLESLQTAIVACDAEGNVTTFNGATRELFGLAKGAPPPSVWSQQPHLFEADGKTPLAREAAPLARALHGDRIENMEMVVAANDRARTVLATATPIKDAAGGKLGAVAALHDITDRKAAEKAAAEHYSDLVRSNRELEQFAYVASHDLQEPLRMVSSFTQLLARRYRGKLDGDADEFIGFAVDGVTRMQRLINDLLAYARVGSRAGDLVETDSGAVLDRTLWALRASIREANATVSRAELPVVRADPSQLDQLFLNLVSNAMKFRSDAPPEVTVSAELEDGRWHFAVRDNGIGIEPQYFERIFVIFQRLHPKDRYDGTGIGLAICKKIVERHGGALWVESQPGSGSTFHFTLPAGVRS